MKHHWSLVFASLLVAACSPSQSKQVVDSAPDGAYPARLPLANVALPAEAAPVQAEGGAWQLSADGSLRFAVAGQPAMFSIACQADVSGVPSVRLERVTRAPGGAKAMFALIGNGRIARLPLDVVTAGEPGEWRGLVPAADPRLDVLKGGNRIEATLPGGGTVMLPASTEPGRLLEACRASGPQAISA